MTDRIATSKDWTTLPMPEKHDEFSFRRHFTEEQMNLLRKGFIPEEMEDKWFWYFEDSRLYIHRGWTGFCIYIVSFEEDDLLRVCVNRSPEQYRETESEKDMKKLNDLLSWWSHSGYDPYAHFVSDTLTLLKNASTAEPKND